MINPAEPKPSKRMSASLSALAVFTIGPQAMMQRKALPPKDTAPATKAVETMRLPSIGSVSGTVSWKVGQVTIPTPATDSSIQQVLQMKAVVSDGNPAAVAQAAPFKAQKILPNLPRFGPMTTAGDVASVTYTIGGLPQGTDIRIEAGPGISFENNIHSPVRCTMTSGLEVKNYNFKYTLLMLTDKTVNPSAGSSGVIQGKAGTNTATGKTPLPSIGSISGTVSWKVGEIPPPKKILKGSNLTQSMLGLVAWIKVSPGAGTPGQPSLYGQKKVGNIPQYGQMTTIGNVVSIPYTISGLPQGITIWVQSEIPANSFEGSIPGGVKCTLSSGIEIKNYNLIFRKSLIN